ncbi:MAG: DUF3710 domain-containing protein [Bifidobacteriaceae bacterium]|jgi:hypothetical protein|nr:DUF3710 domain-containing protein [Bifidobacteriaceae bacterium]
MALFRRRPPAGEDEPPEDLAPPAAEAPSGPFDLSQRPDPAGLADFGALRLPLDRSFKLTAELSRQTGQPTAVILAQGGSRLRLTVFAAPKTGGLWQEVRRAEQGAIASRGGLAKEQSGPFGVELLAQLPTTTAQGRQGKQVVRLLGVDGPRWLLRAEIGGKAARDAAAAAPLEALLAQVVVDRGAAAKPPREPLALRLPQAAGLEAAEAEPAGPDRAEAPELLRRGPEITEVR